MLFVFGCERVNRHKLINSIDDTHPSPPSVYVEKQDGDMRKHETATVRADFIGFLGAL
jgi:hypothetical protein